MNETEKSNAKAPSRKGTAANKRKSEQEKGIGRYRGDVEIRATQKSTQIGTKEKQGDVTFPLKNDE
jgi:hypothetical protein